MDILTSVVAGQPAWLWLAFLAFVCVLLWLDLAVFNRKDEVVSPAKSAFMWAGFAVLALAFGGYVYFGYAPPAAFYSEPHGRNEQAAIQFFTGYLLETALAFDNIFVMSLVFAHFAIPREYQHRVLFWGILGAIVFRAAFIGVGAAIVTQFTWVLFLFAAFLIYTGVKMLLDRQDDGDFDVEGNGIARFLKKHIPVTDTIENHNFFARQMSPRGRMATCATPLFLALLMVEFVDIVFAVDSVPAIFAVTRDPFIVYTSNIFAILGLRSMYFMLAAAVERFKYLKVGLALVLVLIGAKIVWNFGLHEGLRIAPHLDAHWSLIATLVLLGGSVLYSLWRTRRGA